MHSILPQHTDGDQLKHGYALCQNMIEHILLYSPACNSLFYFMLFKIEFLLQSRFHALKPTKRFFWAPKSIQTDSHKHHSLLFCIIRQAFPENFIWQFMVTGLGMDTCRVFHIKPVIWHVGISAFRIRELMTWSKKNKRVLRGRLPIYIINHDTSTLTKTFFWPICHPIYSFHHLSKLRNFAISRNQISNLGNILFLVMLIPKVLLNFCC